MKKFLVSAILALSLTSVTTACVAGPFHHEHFWGGHRGWAPYRGGWWGPGSVLAGVIIGGVIMHDIDVNAQPYPGYTRTVVCQPWTYIDQWGRQITEQQCHVEWVPAENTFPR